MRILNDWVFSHFNMKSISGRKRKMEWDRHYIKISKLFVKEEKYKIIFLKFYLLILKFILKNLNFIIKNDAKNAHQN